jgi:hypothetical protein
VCVCVCVRAFVVGSDNRRNMRSISIRYACRTTTNVPVHRRTASSISAISSFPFLLRRQTKNRHHTAAAVE